MTGKSLLLVLPTTSLLYSVYIGTSLLDSTKTTIGSSQRDKPSIWLASYVHFYVCNPILPDNTANFISTFQDSSIPWRPPTRLFKVRLFKVRMQKLSKSWCAHPNCETVSIGQNISTVDNSVNKLFRPQRSRMKISYTFYSIKIYARWFLYSACVAFLPAFCKT